MRILVTNDDGIKAPGIERLARMAARLGEVTVVAPSSQCSAMSQKLTIMSSLHIRRVDPIVPGLKDCFAVDGTPADCVKCGINALMEEKPDIIFSGINAGYNSGFDIAYSGTVGAAMESVMGDIPAIAFSTDYFDCDYAVVDEYMYSVAKRLVDYTFGSAETENDPVMKYLGDSFDPQMYKLGHNEIWNVNFPQCRVEECKGIIYDRAVAPHSFYENDYHCMYRDDRDIYFRITPYKVETRVEGTDIAAIKDNYISVSRIKCLVL